MKIINVRRADRPSEHRLATVCEAMLDTLTGHALYDEDDMHVIVTAADGADGHGVVVSVNVEEDNRVAMLFAMLNADLKGTGTAAIIVTDRAQG